MEDASLDDFLDAGDESSDESGTTSEPSTTDEESAASTEPDTDPSAENEDADAVTDTADDVEAVQEEPSDAAEPTDSDVAPARSTMTFSPDASECAACGESVTRRWTDGDDLVCRDCKEW